tara:strand:+ start:10931 stop:11944 length:1014 start_codon:yes stop_codon:yes gene_type:complete
MSNLSDETDGKIIKKIMTKLSSILIQVLDTTKNIKKQLIQDGEILEDSNSKLIIIIINAFISIVILLFVFIDSFNKNIIAMKVVYSICFIWLLIIILLNSNIKDFSLKDVRNILKIKAIIVPTMILILFFDFFINLSSKMPKKVPVLQELDDNNTTSKYDDKDNNVKTSNNKTPNYISNFQQNTCMKEERGDGLNIIVWIIIGVFFGIYILFMFFQNLPFINFNNKEKLIEYKLMFKNLYATGFGLIAPTTILSSLINNKFSIGTTLEIVKWSSLVVVIITIIVDVNVLKKMYMGIHDKSVDIGGRPLNTSNSLSPYSGGKKTINKKTINKKNNKQK